MYKKSFKFLLTLFIIITLMFSFSICFADEDVNSNNTVTTSEENVKTEENEPQINNGDLYLFNNKVVMDQLVDGNVFIFGNDVEITGQVNGNLFVFANNVKFNKSAYVRYSIFACANSIYYNGACNDLYSASNKLEMTYDSYVVRDVKAVSSSTILKAAVGRDVDLATSSLDTGADSEVPIIYGNLRYSSNEEKQISKDIVQGDITYSKTLSNKDNNIEKTIIDILIVFLTCIATTLIIYAFINKFTPQFKNKLSNENLNLKNIFKYLGIGLLSFILVLVICILLLSIGIGAKLAIIIALLFTLLCLISIPIFSIVIANILKPVFKIEKNSIFYLLLSLVSILLYAITLIPYIGFIIKVIIKSIAIGMLINICIPIKELTDEEKKKIEEAKKVKKELKEKTKQEKSTTKKIKEEKNENK